jgi:cell wall-associated NlpC family hydrolase
MSLTFLEKYIGIPYINNGRDFLGCDCYGLIRLFLYHEIGKELDTLDDRYGDSKSSEEVRQVVSIERKIYDEKLYEERQFGDIILMNLVGHPVHVGIVIDDETMIHTLAGHNSAIERYNAPLWKNRIEGIFRVN